MKQQSTNYSTDNPDLDNTIPQGDIFNANQTGDEILEIIKQCQDRNNLNVVLAEALIHYAIKDRITGLLQFKHSAKAIPSKTNPNYSEESSFDKTKTQEEILATNYKYTSTSRRDQIEKTLVTCATYAYRSIKAETSLRPTQNKSQRSSQNKEREIENESQQPQQRINQSEERSRKSSQDLANLSNESGEQAELAINEEDESESTSFAISSPANHKRYLNNQSSEKSI